MPKKTTEEKIAHFKEHGFCRADTAHLPKRIQDALERIGLHPNIKECFANCQRFMLGVVDYGIDLEPTYHEGYVMGLIPFEHAWIEVDGEVVDLTLDDSGERSYDYLKSFTYDAVTIRQNVFKTHRWEQLTEPWRMAHIHPMLSELRDCK